MNDVITRAEHEFKMLAAIIITVFATCFVLGVIAIKMEHAASVERTATVEVRESPKVKEDW